VTSTADDRKGLGQSEALRPFLIVAGVAAVMWLVEILDLVPGTDLDRWGIRPRQLGGLTGIVAAPFLHDGFGHLISNTIPFLVMGWVIAAAGIQRFVQVTVIVAVVAGVGTWLVGPANTVHIGASGLVFGYLGYLVTRGLFEHRVGHILIALVILLFYGSILWGLLPRPGSWAAWRPLGSSTAGPERHPNRTPPESAGPVERRR
jgi:membrane associated rhomboid family serine protease